jgi:hypothetical protein
MGYFGNHVEPKNHIEDRAARGEGSQHDYHASHIQSVLNLSMYPSTSSTKGLLLSVSHAVDACLLIKPNCFIGKAFVLTDYIVHFKGTNTIFSIYFPSFYPTVLKL